MRILVLLTDLFDAVGGIQTFNQCFVKALNALAATHQWEMSLLVLRDSGASDLAGPYLNPATRSSYLGFKGNRLRFAIAGLLASRKADRVILGHVHFSPLTYGTAWNSKRPTTALVVHGTEVWKPLPFLQRLGVTRVEHVLCVSQFTQDQMMKHNRVAPDRFRLFPYALEPLDENSVEFQSRDELGLPLGKMILTVSRLETEERYKGVDTVIRLMPKLLSQVQNAFYVVVGDGTDRRRLEKAAREMGVAHRVIFTGWTPAHLLPSYYRSCDLFILPSTQEGFGIVFIEAMHHAKPCIGYQAGGIPEVIENGVTGLLVEPGDDAQLTQAIVSLLKNNALREQMGRAGQERAHGEFSFETFRNRLEALLKEAPA